MISVIVPVYNVEKYLKTCLDSVINQTYQDLEIILINDGSTDRSREICVQYMGADPRIIFLEEENQGLSAARNFGIDRATGEYITFIDSDDFVDGHMLEILLHNIERYSADVAMCDFCKVSNDRLTPIQSKKNRKSSTKEIFENEFPDYVNKKYSIMVNAWGKLYRREIFREVRYPKGKLHEDEFILYDWLFLCKKIIYVKEILYYYLQRNNGIMGNYGTQNATDTIEAWHRHNDFAITRNDNVLLQITQARMVCAMAVSYKRLKDAKEKVGLSRVYDIFCKLYRKRELHKLMSLEERIGFFLLYKSPQFYIKAISVYRRIRK